jgi:hypothetical protein
VANAVRAPQLALSFIAQVARKKMGRMSPHSLALKTPSFLLAWLEHQLINANAMPVTKIFWVVVQEKVRRQQRTELARVPLARVLLARVPLRYEGLRKFSAKRAHQAGTRKWLAMWIAPEFVQ